MLGASTLAMALSGKGKAADVASFALASGLHVVIDRPGTKIPMCILGDRARKQADQQAVDDALANGKPRPERARHACGIAHALGPDDKQHVRALIARLEKRHGEVNLGIELGASRLVVVDVDTAPENHAFKGWLAAHGALGVQMTVRSPGKLKDGSSATSGPDGQPEWAHRDGGHYWFELPAGVELPSDASSGVLKIEHDGGLFTVMWANRQVLIPPSSRPEGAYVFTGAPVVALPAPLLDAIVEASAQRTNAAALRLAELDERAAEGPSTVDEWDARTPWGDLLEPDGWIDTGKIDNCGCPVWTAPGEHGSYKSATAHDLGCARFDTATGWGPLHVWTDNPPEELAGVRTLTKLDYLARTSGRHRADVAAELGLIEPNPDVAFTAADLPLDDNDGTDRADQQPASVPTPATPATPAVQSLAEADLFEPAIDAAEEVSSEPGNLENSSPAETLAEPKEKLESWRVLLGRFLDQTALNELPDPEPLIDGILDRDTLARMVGKPGCGKTFLALDMACCVATGQPFGAHATRHQGRVVYLVAEGASGWKTRLNAWTAVHNAGQPLTAEQLMIVPFPIQVADDKEWLDLRKALVHLDPALIVFDTQARITVGMEENSATEMGKLVHRLDLLRTDRGRRSTVLLVHHLGHNGDNGRGSSSVLGALHTELRVVDGGDAPDGRRIVRLHVDKQKDDVEREPEDSLITRIDLGTERWPAYLVHADPFEDVTTAPAPNVELTHVPDSAPPYVLLASLIRDTLDGPDEGWTEAAARQLLTGRARNGREIDGAAKRQAWKRLRTGNLSGRSSGVGPPWIEPLEEGKTGRWRMTEVGRELLAEALENGPENV